MLNVQQSRIFLSVFLSGTERMHMLVGGVLAKGAVKIATSLSPIQDFHVQARPLL